MALEKDPAIGVLVANVSQTEVLLRAMNYKTGKMWVSKLRKENEQLNQLVAELSLKN